LGDAVLDFVVGAWLYNRYPEMPEGDLTRMRSALVYTEQLAEFGRQIELGKAMRLGRGEAQAGGRARSALLCDTFEAVIGALYLDAGIDAVLTSSRRCWKKPRMRFWLAQDGRSQEPVPGMGAIAGFTARRSMSPAAQLARIIPRCLRWMRWSAARSMAQAQGTANRRPPNRRRAMRCASWD
jgi:hypothetical protein